MKRAAEKLHSRRGASLIYALLLFLVASMVSVLILNASTTAVQRLNDDREREQEYLLLSSAARLFKKALEKSSVTITTTEKEYFNGNPSETTVDYDNAGVMGGVLETVVKLRNAPSAPAEGTSRSVPLAVSNTADTDFNALARNATLDFTMKTCDSAGKENYPISNATVKLGAESQIIYLSARVIDLTQNKHDVPIIVDNTVTDPETRETTTESEQIGVMHITEQPLKWVVTLSTDVKTGG